MIRDDLRDEIAHLRQRLAEARTREEEMRTVIERRHLKGHAFDCAHEQDANLECDCGYEDGKRFIARTAPIVDELRAAREVIKAVKIVAGFLSADNSDAVDVLARVDRWWSSVEKCVAVYDRVVGQQAQPKKEGGS